MALVQLFPLKICCKLSFENRVSDPRSAVYRSRQGVFSLISGKLKKNSHIDHTSNKSNFRCALHSLKDCIELTAKGDKRGEGAKRTYQFIDPGHRLYDSMYISVICVSFVHGYMCVLCVQFCIGCLCYLVSLPSLM